MSTMIIDGEQVSTPSHVLDMLAQVAQLPLPVPQSVSKMQAQLALHGVSSPSGGKTLLDDVNAAVAVYPDERVRIAWNSSSDLLRHGLFVTTLASTIPGLNTDAALDALFTTASQISV